MDRRHFLKQSSAALAASALLGPTAARATEAARAAGVPAALGIQLYPFREVFPGDVNGVLEMIARFGYAEVEPHTYADRTPAVFRGALDAHGLVSPSAHVGIDVCRRDLDAVLEAAQTVGHRYVVVPWVGPDERTERDGYLALADELNEMGVRARTAGLMMGYHNHEFEFETFGTDRPAYFDFVERLEPDLVTLELDLFWTAFAGVDPLDVFERYPGRFPLWHVKDGGGPDMTQTVIGQGRIDWPSIFAAADTAGLEHAILEIDSPEAPFAFAEASIDYVRSLDA